MRVLIALVLAVTAVAAVPENPQRIVGGSVTTISAYPMMVSLLYRNNLNQVKQACGGTIINNRSVLTAAHCTIGDAADRWQSRVGSTNANSGGTIHFTSQIFNHPQYNSGTYDNDVAIIRVSSVFHFNNNVKAGSIASANYHLGDNQQVWATGWGRITASGAASEQLRHVQIWTVNQATCKNRYNELKRTVTDNMLCSGWLDVGGRDQCQGDSGGPLFHNKVVVGICSWGQSCALARYPGVNARVSRYTSWITSHA